MVESVRRVPTRSRGFSLRPRRRRGRRVVATALALVVLVAAGFAVWHILRPTPNPGRYGIREVRFDLHSRLLHRTLPEVGVLPPPLPDGRHRPLLVFLHGRGGTPQGQATDALFAALRAAGPLAPDVILANGGDHSYYHDRADGPWGTYVVKEVVPDAIRRLDADPGRVAIGGVSMGGFGALDLARLWPNRFCAAGGHSAAMWRTGGETPEGAFDDAADFARNDILGAVEARDVYGSMPVWIDVGRQDPFRSADTAFARALREHGGRVTFHVWPGSHSGSYWASHMTQYVAFYAHALAACR